MEANFQEEAAGAFSAADIQALEFETGLAPEPELEQESDIASNDDSCSDDTGAAEVVSAAADEQAAKEMFYGFLKGGLSFGNKVITRDDPQGPLKSLDLKQYGEIGRRASDQIFDRLASIPFVRRLLMNNRLRELQEKWGDVLVLVVLMKGQLEHEYAERAKAYAALHAAKKAQDAGKAAVDAANDDSPEGAAA